MSAFAPTLGKRQNLLRTVLLEAFREGQPAEEVYRRHADRLEVQGMIPTGMFKRADRSRHLSILEGWQRGLRKVFANRPRPFDPFRFGRGPQASTTGRVEPPLSIDLADETVELRGTTLPAIDTPAASVVLRTASEPFSGPPTHELPGFIDHVVRAAAGMTGDAPYTVWTVYAEGRAARTRFDPMPEGQARDYLRLLVSELRGATHDYLLPFSAIHRAHLRADASDDAWDAILAGLKPARYGPLAGVPAEPATPDRAQDVLTRRFGPFYRLRRPEDGS